jgi:cell division septation protein DedD
MVQFTSPDHDLITETILSVNTPSHTPHGGATTAAAPRRTAETPLRTTETKAAFKTTEFVVFLVAVVGVLIASNLVGETDGRGDPFLADKAWLYITLLTIGYMISRGLAKAGSREHDDA